MGGGSAGSGGSWGGPDEAILRRLLEGQAGATSRVDPFNPMQSGSRYRPDESINDDSGVMTPQGIQNEAIQAALGRQTSRSSGPPQAMEDYVKQAVMAALSKAPIVGGQR
jgi:hypothetical protein